MSLIHAPLPYETNDLEPHLPARTPEFHYWKHHKAYVENTIAAIKDTPLEGADLATIVRTARKTPTGGCLTTAPKPGITISSGIR